MSIRLLAFLLFLLFVEVYAFQAFKIVLKNKTFLCIYVVLSIILLLYIVYGFMQFDRSVGQTKNTMRTMALFLLVYLPKIFVVLVLFLEDVFRIIAGLVCYFSEKNIGGAFLASRRDFVSQIGLAVAAIPFLSLIYGIFEGKYNFKVIKQAIFFADLPNAFDGFRILQISDVHSGSFDNSEKIAYAIDLINQQNADLILFTGDIVNTHAKEMEPWIDTFNKIKKAAYGNYAVLGNHDYGEYASWKTKKEKQTNFEAIKGLYGRIGFRLLLNEHVFIKKGTQQMALIGVENWGHNFKQAGDLEKAAAGLSQLDFKVLMSHDPSHWEYVVKNDAKHYQLTLSGHTHGMQFGIEIPGYFKWSLVQYIYKQWAGLYEHLGRYIYVNRGFGFHAYPGRVGIMPEITIIELKKKE